jgi:hypothetical protein
MLDPTCDFSTMEKQRDQWDDLFAVVGKHGKENVLQEYLMW